MEEVFRFKSIHSALRFYRDCKPGRVAQVNIFEPDRKRGYVGIQFDERMDGSISWSNHPHDAFAAVTLAIENARRYYGRDQAWRAFEALYLAPREDERGNSYLCPDSCADSLGVSRATLFRRLGEIKDIIRANLEKKGYLSPENDKLN